MTFNIIVQGDVLAIMNGSGTIVVEYTYDAWGYIRNTTGTMATTFGKANALRYRSYVYDPETSFYYLQSRYYDPELGRFLNADSYASTGQGVLGNNMFAYCGNNPVNKMDPSGEFGLLTTLAVVGITISAVVGGVVAGVNTATSGGSVGEIIWSVGIGAVTADAIATVAALGAAGALSVGNVVLISGGIGATGEVASIGVEYAYHRNDENYSFDWGTAATRVAYAGGIGAPSGYISYGLNNTYTGSDEIIGACISGEMAVALGLVDFGTRQLINAASGSSASSPASMAGSTRMNCHFAVAY